MSLQKLARELDETGRQTSEMLEGISQALTLLAQKPLGDDPKVKQAVHLIITALQGQDRIEQRCRNIALAARQFALLPPTAPESVYVEIWESLTLDELRVPELSGVARNHSSGDADLF
ncbi:MULTISPECIES: hypothetical protein [unclassified Devosia]|uniref:hypothetical protein n=1 Tax=unclassified Devosia TaxID=196773 RepID=UPI00145F814D|nr:MULTISPECIES: hypothetical protein [unclassified Devosia]MBJ6987722.1 hypothetical protein [Devosia sp. MC521]QMW62397.1 hypothetical protein H4N61_15980 [Devosia sp. MC521]